MARSQSKSDPFRSDLHGVIYDTESDRAPESEPLATRVSLHPFLVGMNHTHLALLTDCALSAHFAAGEIILQQGELADRFYLIETGDVALESSAEAGEPVIVDTIAAGDLLGWSWMFPPYVWHFSARALKPTSALYFYGTILRQYCERNHSLGYELLKRAAAVMIRRMQKARDKMLAVHSGHGALEPVVLFSGPADTEYD